MALKYFLKINESRQPDFLVEYDSDSKSSKKREVADWQDLKGKQLKVLDVILSAKLVLQKTVSVPSKKEEVLRQSIPFLLEEELADDIADNHFAYFPLDEPNYMVSVVNKGVMDELMEQFKMINLNVKNIYSEVFTCPSSNSALNLCVDDNKVIAREGFLGSSFSKASLKPFIQLSKAPSIHIYTDQQSFKSNSERIAVSHLTNLLDFQIDTLINAKKVNLIQGSYSGQEDSGKNKSPWKKVVVLSVVLLISWLSIHIFQILKLDSQIYELQEQQKNILKEVVEQPTESELNSPYAAFLSRMKLQEQNSTTQSDGFVNAIRALGVTLKQFSTVSIQSIRLRQQEMEVLLLAPNSQQLNDFQSVLESNSYNMRVRTGTRNNSSEGVNGILILEIL